MSIYDNARSLQCVKRAWMRENTWEWWLVHTDWCQYLFPRYIGTQNQDHNLWHSDFDHPNRRGRLKSGNAINTVYQIERLFYGCFIHSTAIFSIRAAI